MDIRRVQALGAMISYASDPVKIRDLAHELVMLLVEKPLDGSLASGPPSRPTPSVSNADQSTCYGCGGRTGPGDPRSDTMMKHEFDRNGKPVEVHGAVITQPLTTYKCVLLDLIPHDESCQVYVEVLRADGTPDSKTNARLLTGWRESTSDYDRLYDAPASPGNFSMGKEAKFYAPALGPCGAVVVDDHGQIDSDMVGSLGISQGQHMSFRVVFQERD